jgi:hypothetical protein
MRYFGGTPLELPLPADPGIILFHFFSSASATAFIILSWLMAALAKSLYDKLERCTRHSCRWMVSPARYRLAFFSFMCSQIHCGSLAQGPGTPSAYCGADPQIGGVHGRQYGIHPMGHGDHQAGWGDVGSPPCSNCASELLHSVQSLLILYSEVVQTWTLWCGASCSPVRGRSHQQRLAGELPENPSLKNPSLGVGVAGARLNNARCSPLASSSGHSAWLVVAPGR